MCTYIDSDEFSIHGNTDSGVYAKGARIPVSCCESSFKKKFPLLCVAFAYSLLTHTQVVPETMEGKPLANSAVCLV